MILKIFCRKKWRTSFFIKLMIVFGKIIVANYGKKMLAKIDLVF
jgi:hypothetical protein